MNFLFLCVLLLGSYWLFFRPSASPIPSSATAQPVSGLVVSEPDPIYPREEAEKLQINLSKYDDCDVAKIFYQEGLKIESCATNGFRYRQKTQYKFDTMVETTMYDTDMRELGSYSRRTNASGNVLFSGMVLGGDCRTIGTIEEVCGNK